MIRAATLEDVPALVAMGGEFLATTPYRDRLADVPDARAATMVSLIEQEQSTVFVVDKGDGPVGMLGMLLYRQPLSGEAIAGEVFWWVDPEHRGAGLALWRAGETWARAMGARKIQMIAPTEDVEQIYAARGYAPLERVYQRELA